MTVVIKCDSYSDVYLNLKKAVGGMDKFVKKGDKVLLKPNILLGAHPDKAVTTHPEFVRAAAKLVREAGGKVFLGDSPSPSIDLIKALKKCLIYDVCVEEKIEILYMDKPTRIKGIGKIKRFDVSSAVKEMDIIINLPKLKTHGLTTYTGAVKNLYGLIPGFRKLKFHVTTPSPEQFSNMLLDLYLALKSKVKLNLMDGILGMEGNGPFQGTPKESNVIIVSTDALELDFAATRFIQLDKITPLIRLARKRKLLDNPKIESNLKPIRFKPPGNSMMANMPRPLYAFFKKFFYKRPVINYKKCTRCHACIKVCPVKAIYQDKERWPIIDYKKCIRCYCCHEVCPAKAIDIKR